jgi:hypothetical protein
VEDTYFIEKKNGNSTSLVFTDFGAKAGEEGFDVLPSDARARWVHENCFECSLMGAIQALYGTGSQYRAKRLRFLMPNVLDERTNTGLPVFVLSIEGLDFLWLLQQHVLPKGLQRARNFGFLHHNSRCALHLLQLLHLRPSAAQAPVDVPAQRPIWRCACGGAMVVLRRRIKPDAVPPCTAPQTAQPDKRVPVEVTKH